MPAPQTLAGSIATPGATRKAAGSNDRPEARRATNQPLPQLPRYLEEIFTQEFELPESVYGVGMVGVMFLWCPCVAISQVYLPLIMNYYIQWTIVLHLWHHVETITQGEHIECAGDSGLRQCCLVVFVAVVLDDLVESIKMIRWMRLMDPCIGSRMGDHSCGPGDRDLAWYKSRAEGEGNEDTNEGCENCSGKALVYQAAIVVFIIAGKLLLACLIGVAGSAVILLSKHQEGMILNTTAVCFIFETDELIYKVLISSGIKKLFNQVKTVTANDSFTRLCGMLSINGGSLTFALVLYIVVRYMDSYCN